MNGADFFTNAKKAQEKERKTFKKTRGITDGLQKLGEDQTFKNPKDPSKQRTATINQLKYHKFVLKSKCGNQNRFQQSTQGRAFTLQKLKKYITTFISESDNS